MRSPADRIDGPGGQRPCFLIIPVLGGFQKIIHLAAPAAVILGFGHHVLIPQPVKELYDKVFFAHLRLGEASGATLAILR